MGKKWDYDVPGVETWKECLRVLKPGGTALIFAGSRTQHRMAVAVEDAGFILKDCIMWLYGSGFPKATDISKQLDKGVERKVVGKRTDGAGNKQDYLPSDRSKASAGVFGGDKQEYNLTEPATTEAKLWNGWKSHGLKPAYEPILVAMKPNDGTYANNALKHGVSGLNIDGGRIEHNEPEWHTKRSPRKDDITFSSKNCGFNSEKTTMASASPKGRFPANIILDEEAGKMLDEQSGESRGGKTYNYSGDKEYQVRGFLPDNKPNSPSNRGDKGGASRFFYVAKASKKERNMGCEGLEDRQIKHGLHSTSFIGEKEYKTNTIGKNNHPTVKPIALIEYLCILTKTPTGGTVLDPFTGSGTTGLACQNTGRDFIGIEMEEEYCKIAEARLKHNAKQEKLL